MKYIKLGYLMFVKNFRLNFVVVFQIVAMVLVGINLASLLSMDIKASTTLAPLTESKFVYYMSTQNLLNVIDFNEDNHDVFEMQKKSTAPADLSLTNVKFKTRIFLTDAIVNEDASKYTSVYAYNKQMIDALKLPLKNGFWFNEKTKSDDNVIDAVSNLNNIFKTGDIINLTTISKESKKVDFKVRIIGSLKNPAYIPNTSSTGQHLFSVSLSDDTTYNKTGLPAILINSEDIEGIEDIFANTPKNEFIVFNDDISKEEYDANLKELSSKGLTATTEDINRGDNEWKSTLYKENLPMIIFLLILSVAGLVSISIINMTNYLKTFSIYFICGCTWKNCYKIIISYLSIIFSWTFALTLLLALIFSKVQIPIFSLIEFSFLSCIWFISVILIYFVLSLITPALIFKNSTLKEILNKK